MATVVISLIYKERGHRYDLVAPQQNAFQRSKYIFDDNRTVLDAVDYLLCLQTFMSLMATDDGDGDPSCRLRGVHLSCLPGVGWPVRRPALWA